MINKLVARLLANGYQSRPTPLHVADQQFACDAVLEGPGGDAELVLIVSWEESAFPQLQRRLRALTLALDGSSSARPLTVILVGPPLSPTQVQDLLRIIRVISIPNDATDASMDTLLAPLLVLDLPRGVEHGRSTDDLLNQQLGSLRDDPLVKPLIEAAAISSEAVEEAFIQLLDSILSESSPKGAPDA